MANQPTKDDCLDPSKKIKDDWVDSLKTLLINVLDYDYIQPSTIPMVPERLKKLNEDAYMPRVVSIGPRFKGSRDDLILMEEVKLRCMLSLLHRGADVASDSLNKCSKAVWELDKEVRTSYARHIEFQQRELSTIMLLDGCFLLELLISKGLDSQFPSRLDPPGPANEVLKDQDVLSDLMLLENQIPIMVLHKLSQILFPNEFEPDRIETEEEKKERIEREHMIEMEEEKKERIEREHRIETEEEMKEMIERERMIEREEQRKRELRAKKINKLVLTVLGYSTLQLPCHEAPHILDLVHFFVNRRTSGSTNISSQDEDHVVVDIDTHTTETQQQQLKLKRCALRLLTAGVTINMKHPLEAETFRSCSCFSCGTLFWLCKNLFSWVWNILYDMLLCLCSIFPLNSKYIDVDRIPEEVKWKGLDFSFKFQSGKLVIEQLHITKTTKAKWCNLIAWEHHKKNNYFSRFVSESISTSAALIFNGLICSEDDVQFLKDKKIIVDHLKMSNEELMNFFRTIASGIDHKVVDVSSHRELVCDINNYSKAFFIKQMWYTVLTLFTYRHHWWLFKFLNRNYNFVATILFILTAVQTVYAILAYNFPK